MILARKIRAVATGYFKSIFGRALDILVRVFIYIQKVITEK
jgi:hypothetical protein